jgi:Na+-driven multidrug efflux pump
MRPDRPRHPARGRAALIAAWSKRAASGGSGLTGNWTGASRRSDLAVQHAATVALEVAALTQPMAALAFVLDGLILGISDYVAMRRAMILAILAYVPVAVLVLRFHALGLPGIWTALGLWLAARAVLLGRR